MKKYDLENDSDYGRSPQSKQDEYHLPSDLEKRLKKRQDEQYKMPAELTNYINAVMKKGKQTISPPEDENYVMPQDLQDAVNSAMKSGERLIDPEMQKHEEIYRKGLDMSGGHIPRKALIDELSHQGLSPEENARHMYTNMTGQPLPKKESTSPFKNLQKYLFNPLDKTLGKKK